MFKCPEAEVDRAEEASYEDGVGYAGHPVDVRDKLGGVGESDIVRIGEVVDVEGDHADGEHEAAGDEHEDRLGDLALLEADGAEGEGQDGFCPAQREQPEDVDLHAIIIEVRQSVAGSFEQEHALAISIGEEEAHQAVGCELQGVEHGGHDEADDQVHREPFLQRGRRDHQEVRSGLLLGQLAVDLDACADHGDDADDGEFGIFDAERDHGDVTGEDQGEELDDDEQHDGHDAQDQQAEAVVVLGVPQIVQEVVAETLYVEDVIHC